LYPFGNIAPLTDEPITDTESQLSLVVPIPDPDQNPEAFNKLVKVKYQYPAEQMTKQEWKDDIAIPLKVTVKEIEKDLR